MKTLQIYNKYHESIISKIVFFVLFICFTFLGSFNSIAAFRIKKSQPNSSGCLKDINRFELFNNNMTLNEQNMSFAYQTKEFTHIKTNLPGRNRRIKRHYHNYNSGSEIGGFIGIYSFICSITSTFLFSVGAKYILLAIGLPYLIIAFVLSIFGTIFGIISVSSDSDHRGLAIAGIIIGIIMALGCSLGFLFNATFAH